MDLVGEENTGRLADTIRLLVMQVCVKTLLLSSRGGVNVNPGRVCTHAVLARCVCSLLPYVDGESTGHLLVMQA